MHDELGEFTSYLLPESISAAGDAEPGPQSGANKWHKAILLSRRSQGADGQQRHNLDSGDSPTDRGTVSIDGTAKGKDPAGGANAEAQKDSRADADSSIFEVKFDSGRTATLDLCHFSIRWISFLGHGLGNATAAHDGSRLDTNISANGNAGGRSAGGGRLSSSRPPGFVSIEDLSGPLANSQADVGTRVDVWWPRYNSYFRATVRENPSHEKSAANRTPALHFTCVRSMQKMQPSILSKLYLISVMPFVARWAVETANCARTGSMWTRKNGSAGGFC